MAGDSSILGGKPVTADSGGRKVWTADEVRALGVRVDGITACAVVLGTGRSLSYELLRTGRVPFRVLKAGRRYVVPVADVLAVLGLEPATGATTAIGQPDARAA